MEFSVKNTLARKIVDWLLKQKDSGKFPLTDFDRIRYEIRLCDVLLIEGRSRVSQVIKVVTQSPWSHAALYIGRLHDIENADTRDRILKFYPEAKPHEQLLIESVLGKGTIISPLDEYQQDHIRICRPRGLNAKDAQAIINYAARHLGIQYDTRQIFDLLRFLMPWSIFPRRFRSSLFRHHAGELTKESCSMLLAEAFNSVHFPIRPILREHKEKGVELLHRFPKLYTPSDFDYSPFFEIIKYPIFELSDTPRYRNLPWDSSGALSDDSGKVTPPPPKTETKEKKPKSKPQAWDFMD